MAYRRYRSTGPSGFDLTMFIIAVVVMPITVALIVLFNTGVIQFAP